MKKIWTILRGMNEVIFKSGNYNESHVLLWGRQLQEPDLCKQFFWANTLGGLEGCNCSKNNSDKLKMATTEKGVEYKRIFIECI